MIDTTDANASNTASIPPPKIRAVRFTDSIHSQKARAGIHQQTRGSLFSIGRAVPFNPAVCLANSLRNQWKSYRKQLRECQKDFSETSVHQLRVATRRLMTHLALVGSVVSADKVPKAQKKLKRHLKLLGKLRDAQVQRIFIDQQVNKYPCLILLSDFLKQRERALVKDTARKVASFKSRKLEQWTLELCQQLETWHGNPGERELFAGDLQCAMADAFGHVADCRQTIDPADVQTIHRTRVAFKKFRYMVEALSPDFTGLGKRQLRRIGNYQRRMGNLQDLEILQDCVARFLREHPENEMLVAPFSRHLHRLRGRALRSCLKHADDLFLFWDAARLGENHHAPLSRTAA